MIKPIKNKLLVKPIGKSTETESGLFKGDADRKEKFIEKGSVIDLGPEVTKELNKAHTVYFDRWAGTSVSIDGDNHLMLKDDEIQAYEI
jgi:chaperonin GroES